jgi:hypothetical protein
VAGANDTGASFRLSFDERIDIAVADEAEHEAVENLDLRVAEAAALIEEKIRHLPQR